MLHFYPSTLQEIDPSNIFILIKEVILSILLLGFMRVLGDVCLPQSQDAWLLQTQVSTSQLLTFVSAADWILLLFKVYFKQRGWSRRESTHLHWPFDLRSYKSSICTCWHGHFPFQGAIGAAALGSEVRGQGLVIRRIILSWCQCSP